MRTMLPMFSKNEQSVVQQVGLEASPTSSPSVFSAKLVTRSPSEVARKTRPAPSSSAVNIVGPPAGVNLRMQSDLAGLLVREPVALAVIVHRGNAGHHLPPWVQQAPRLRELLAALGDERRGVRCRRQLHQRGDGVESAVT